MAQRTMGDGSVYQEAGGGWRGKISLGFDPVTGKHITKRVRAKTKTEAFRKLRQLQREMEGGLKAQNADMTVADLMKHQLEIVLPSRKRTTSTIENYQWAFDRLAPYIGKIRLRDLSPEDVERALAQQTIKSTGEPMSKSSLDRLRSALSSALKEAARRSWVSRNVAEVALTPPSRESAQRRAMSIEQVQRLLEAADGTSYKPMLLIGVMLGLRPGEIMALTWSSIDLNATPATVRVERWLGRDNDGFISRDVKTQSSFRLLVLPEQVVEALRGQRLAVNEMRAKAGEKWQENDLVFPTRTGRLSDRSNFRRALRRYCDKAELGRWAPYELRHTAVTLASEAGVPLEAIADMAGHADTRMVMTTYRHISGAAGASLAIADQLATQSESQAS